MQSDKHRLPKQLDYTVKVLEKKVLKYMYLSIVKKYLSIVLNCTLKNVLMSTCI